MAGSRYSQKVDLQNWNSSHSLAVLSIPPGSRVLDLGTADGSVACALKKRGCTVWGVEFDEQAAEAARRVCDRVIVADLEATHALDVLEDETFDVVLALDVLEHLRDPAPVLRRAASRLAPKGVAVVSIPNVTHGALRLNLLLGRFNYTEQGLLDRTHLRFFDRRSAEQLMSDAGLTITQRLRVTRALDETEITVKKEDVPAPLLDSLAGDRDATTYQFVFVAARENGSPETLSAGMLPERLLAENERLLAQLRELETYAKNLQTERAQTQPALAAATAETEAIRTQFGELEKYAKSLEAALRGVREAGAPELAECQNELARAQSLQARTTAEVVEVQRQHDEARQELTRRTQEVHRLHLELKHCKADVVVKDAFISDLRQQLLPLRAERNRLSAEHKYLTKKRKQLSARRDQLLGERDRLLATQENMQTTLRALRTYTNSAGFRLVEGLIARLRSFPMAYTTTQTLVRKIVKRQTGAMAKKS